MTIKTATNPHLHTHAVSRQGAWTQGAGSAGIGKTGDLVDLMAAMNDPRVIAAHEKAVANALIFVRSRKRGQQS